VTQTTLGDFPARTHDKLRYGDTDRQGHVNNAVFATLFETGRVEVLKDPERALADEGCDWVIARLELDYVGELTWPGRVETGTGVLRIGRSSVTLGQALFEGDRLVARAQTVIVQMDTTTRGSRALSDAARARFGELTLTNP